ncbi:Na+/H+ antiporter subunit E [Specibacter cremeus]|uniref:Na+/H+ antiporter subunit E n=1 Tax=Specibacter cremeus TaxID=1629051 RepID=UPI003B8365E0
MARVPWWQRLPLLLWLVFVWGALWRDFSAGNLLFGALIALAVTWVFYLPPVALSGRFNVPRAVLYAFRFLWDVATASVAVLYQAIVHGPRIRNAVIAVPLRSTSDLIMTATGHVLSLIPGSLVVDVDRATSTLYVHALNVPTPEAVEKVRADIRAIEAHLIRILGTRAEVAMVREEQAAAKGVRA